ncbi:MAG: class I SAM-dependent methyltransferase [Bacillota bacterium]|nr:class I SAM-dependent methyltransferase [Bacillota bacterium]
MSESDRERWNRRYAEGRGPRQEPDPFLVASLPWLHPVRTPARALDLASGPGGNALWLAERGWSVEALDISDVALERLTGEARRRGLSGRIRARRADLERWRLPSCGEAAYDLVVLTWYLERRLLPEMRKAVRPGGFVLVRTFLRGTRRPLPPAWVLEPGELLEAYRGWRTLRHAESTALGEAAYLGQRPAGTGATAGRPSPLPGRTAARPPSSLLDGVDAEPG